MTTRIDLINRALVEIGQSPVVEGVPPVDTCVMTYETHIGALVSSYPWTFQTKLAPLGRLTQAPVAHWRYAYQLPADMAGTPRAIFAHKDDREPIVDFEIIGDRLVTDRDAIWCRYTFRPEPGRWPGHFILLAVTALKAQFALTIREDTTLHNTLNQIAFGTPSQGGQGGLWASSAHIDNSGQPSRVVRIGSNPLTRGRVT